MTTKVKPRFKIGDVLEVITWDQEDDRWHQGIIRIKRYWPKAPYTEHGVYDTEHIKGNVTWISVNADVLNEATNLDGLVRNGHATYVKYIANIKNKKALKILYGRKK